MKPITLASALLAAAALTIAATTSPAPINPEPVTPPILTTRGTATGWDFISPNLAAALATQDGDHDWTRCLLHFDTSSIAIYCPADGYTVRLGSLEVLS